MAALPPKAAPQQVSTLENWPGQVKALLEKRLGPQAIHDRLRLKHSEFRGSLGSLKRLVQRIRRERGVLPEEVTIPVDTEPGEVAQVDGFLLGILECSRSQGFVYRHLAERAFVKPK